MIITLNYDNKTVHLDGTVLAANIPNMNFTKQLLDELFNMGINKDVTLRLIHDNEIVILGEWNG